jgi:hypothetical protein
MLVCEKIYFIEFLKKQIKYNRCMKKAIKFDKNNTNTEGSHNVLEILTPEQAKDLDHQIERYKNGKVKAYSAKTVFAEAFIKFNIGIKDSNL